MVSHSLEVVYDWRMELDDFVAAIQERLRRTGHTKHSAAVSHGLPKDAIQRVLAGKVPKLDRAVAICDALDLELYIGPKREAFSGLDPLAFALALRHMETTIALMMVGEVNDADMLAYFARVYELQLYLLERVVAAGHSREEAASLIGKRDVAAPPEQVLADTDIIERRRALRGDAEAITVVDEALRAGAEGPGAEEASPKTGPAKKP